MPPTWDEYLVDVANYLSAVRWAAEVGTGVAPAAPARPDELLPERCRDEAERLSIACDQLVAELTARLAAARGRLPAARPRPHEVAPPANYVQTEM